MTFNHEAIRKAYPQVVTIDDGTGAFDANGNPVQLDQAKVNAAAVIVAQEQALATAQRNRATAYATEADPLFFKAQRGEATIEEWQAKVAEIRSRYPYPGDQP
jgi:ABC-type Fe3+-hydroxamate transport system substrate-binding protein